MPVCQIVVQRSGSKISSKQHIWIQRNYSTLKYAPHTHTQYRPRFFPFQKLSAFGTRTRSERLRHACGYGVYSARKRLSPWLWRAVWPATTKGRKENLTFGENKNPDTHRRWVRPRRRRTKQERHSLYLICRNKIRHPVLKCCPIVPTSEAQ